MSHKLVPEDMFEMESAKETDHREAKIAIAARNYLRRAMLESARPEVACSTLKHKMEGVMLAAGIELPLRQRAERFLRTSSPHHREREWYKLIELLLAEPSAPSPRGKQ